MARVWNFNAGPAALPEEVLQQVQNDLLDWHGCGMSVMEMSHRGGAFKGIAEQAETDLAALLDLPGSHRILFLQGGASLQFAMVPMNLLKGKTGNYVSSGSWSKKAITEARRIGAVHIAASNESTNATHFPAIKDWEISADAAYVHYTANETINGLECADIPFIERVPLVSDMSSNMLSRPFDVSQFALIYAGAQKNIGPAGLTIVIVREDVLDESGAALPAILDYRSHIKAGSMYNTPPTFSWYVASLIFSWLREQGGLAAIAECNARKAAKLYGLIDGSGFYHNPIEPQSRSLMNVPFILEDPSMDEQFLKESKAAGFEGLKGHRSVGGMRASLYNAVSEQAVDELLKFMRDFEQKRG